MYYQSDSYHGLELFTFKLVQPPKVRMGLNRERFMFVFYVLVRSTYAIDKLPGPVISCLEPDISVKYVENWA